MVVVMLPEIMSSSIIFEKMLSTKQIIEQKHYYQLSKLLSKYIIRISHSQIPLSLNGTYYLNSDRSKCTCFGVIGILTLICYSGWYTKLITHNQNEVVLERCNVVYEKVVAKIYFFCTKT